MLFHKPLLKLFLISLLPFLLLSTQQKVRFNSLGKSSDEPAKTLGNSFGSINPINRYPGNDPKPENHPDLNLAIRGHVATNGEKYPIVLGEGGDPKAPQIGKMLKNRPTIVSLYKIYAWDWATNRKTVPMPVPNDPAASVKQVQMIGLSTAPGEEILAPPAGYEIGDGFNAMVLFTDNNSITLKYTRDDDIGIKNGYAIQIEEINVDPGLMASYNQLNGSGRNELPAVSGSQVVGSAKGSEIRVVIRDTGDFLDPRSKLDWWQGVDYPPVPTDVISNPTLTPLPSTIIPTSPGDTPIIPTNPIINNSPTPISVNPTVQPTTYNPSPPLPTSPQPTTYDLQPTTISLPTLIPTPTKTFSQKIAESPLLKFMKSISASISDLLKVMLP